MQKIIPCLWFDTQAEAAVKYYTSIFPNSSIGDITRYGEAGPRPSGTVLTVEFELNGEKFTALNGGPEFKFTEAVSFQIFCKNQAEIDDYHQRLSAGGAVQDCGWVKDRFGLSWQIVPKTLKDMLTDKDGARSQRVMKALLQMKKIDLATLERAYEGEYAHA